MTRSNVNYVHDFFKNIFMHVINLITQRKDESKGKKKAARHTWVSKPSHLSEILPERTYILSWSN